MIINVHPHTIIIRTKHIYTTQHPSSSSAKIIIYKLYGMFNAEKTKIKIKINYNMYNISSIWWMMKKN